MFYGSSVYGLYQFGVLAEKWPKLMRRWEEIESILPRYRTNNDKTKLSRHLTRLTVVVFMSSIGKNCGDDW